MNDPTSTMLSPITGNILVIIGLSEDESFNWSIHILDDAGIRYDCIFVSGIIITLNVCTGDRVFGCTTICSASKLLYAEMTDDKAFGQISDHIQEHDIVAMVIANIIWHFGNDAEPPNACRYTNL